MKIKKCGDKIKRQHNISSCSLRYLTRDLKIYKNTLNIQGQMESVEIFDVFGKLVLTSTNNIINTSDLAEGVYVVNIINTNNMIITKESYLNSLKVLNLLCCLFQSFRKACLLWRCSIFLLIRIKEPFL